MPAAGRPWHRSRTLFRCMYRHVTAFLARGVPPVDGRSPMGARSASSQRASRATRAKMCLMNRDDERVSAFAPREFVTLQPSDRLDFADDVMKLGQIRHMPVPEEHGVVGVVSRRADHGDGSSPSGVGSLRPRRSECEGRAAHVCGCAFRVGETLIETQVRPGSAEEDRASQCHGAEDDHPGTGTNGHGVENPASGAKVEGEFLVLDGLDRFRCVGVGNLHSNCARCRRRSLRT